MAVAKTSEEMAPLVGTLALDAGLVLGGELAAARLSLSTQASQHSMDLAGLGPDLKSYATTPLP